MTKTQHIQFLVLMIPTILILIAAAVSVADIALPATEHSYSVAVADTVWDDRPAQ